MDGQQYPQAGYGSYYGQQQYGVGQYAYPKKKFPWLYVILGAVGFIMLIVIIWLLFFRGPGTPELLVSPTSVNIQTSAGETTSNIADCLASDNETRGEPTPA